MPKAPKYAHPHEWAEERVDELVEAGNVTELASMLRETLGKLDSDQIQDLFQSDMERDGYFATEDEERCPECGAIIDSFSDVCESCEDDREQDERDFDEREGKGPGAAAINPREV